MFVIRRAVLLASFALLFAAGTTSAQPRPGGGGPPGGGRPGGSMGVHPGGVHPGGMPHPGFAGGYRPFPGGIGYGGFGPGFGIGIGYGGFGPGYFGLGYGTAGFGNSYYNPAYTRPYLYTSPAYAAPAYWQQYASPVPYTLSYAPPVPVYQPLVYQPTPDVSTTTGPATLTIVTAEGAQVWFDGTASEQKGTIHTITTPTINAGTTQTVTVKMVGANGSPVTMPLQLKGGDKTSVDLSGLR